MVLVALAFSAAPVRLVRRRLIRWQARQERVPAVAVQVRSQPVLAAAAAVVLVSMRALWFWNVGGDLFLFSRPRRRSGIWKRQCFGCGWWCGHHRRDGLLPMIRKLLLFAAFAWLALISAATPQGYQCRTAPNGASTPYCASEAFITQHFPSSSTAGHVATYADSTGQELADGGAPAGGTVTSVTCGRPFRRHNHDERNMSVADDNTVWRTAATTDTIGTTDCLKTSN